MELYLLRHGLAGKFTGRGDDSKRPLTPKGKRKLERIAKAMQAMELSLDYILSSPYTRARQTAEIVAEAFELTKALELTEALTPSGDMEALILRIHQLKPTPKAVLLAGHEPYLSELASWLVWGDSNASIQFKKGGLCKLSTDFLKTGRCATLEWLLTPGQMELMMA
jgi:phosphohistidine phosphatase